MPKKQKKVGGNRSVIVYNFDTTFAAIRARDEEGMRATVQEFVRAIKTALPIADGQQMRLFLCPSRLFFNRPSLKIGYNPFQSPIQGKRYRKSFVNGILWLSNGEDVAEYFPYSICFSKTSVSFDVGPREDALAAAKIVYEVIRNDNDIDISSMTPPQDLVTRFVLSQLPTATQTIM